MEIFINNLRRSLNHISNEEHRAFHKVIKEIAEKYFSGIKDPQIEEWLNTEEMYASEFSKETPKELDSELADFMLSDKDLRADTDRFLFVTIQYILDEKPVYEKNLQKFRSDIEPKLADLTLSPDYSIETIDQMPYDAAHLLHVFLSQKLQQNGPVISYQKILPSNLLNDYIKASSQLRSYYGFGGSLFSESLEECISLLREIHKHLSTYLKRARAKDSSRYGNSKTILQSIDVVISGL